MEHFKVDFLKESADIPPKGPNRLFKNIVKTLFYTMLFLIVGGLVFSYRIATSGTSLSKHNGGTSLFTQVKYFIGFGGDELAGEDGDRINILLMGIGGVGHEGPNLTDTIILVSVNPSDNKVALISIPRDLIVWQGKFGWRKINNANAFGEAMQSGNGGAFASDIISKTFNIPIPYYIKIDFEGLTSIVDILGGLTIDVERSFSDSSYPTDDLLTRTVSFKAGEQVMDGETVLEYVRSRHGTNGEGSDFARGRRQQKVLEGLKSQALSLGILLNPSKINSLLKTIEANVETNLKDWEIARLAGMIKDMANNKTVNLVLDDSPEGLLTSSISEEGAYILSPRSGSFSDISYRINYIVTPENERPQSVKIAVKNGTLITGLAAKAAEKLEEKNYFITQVANASKKDWEQTTIYKLTGNATSEDIRYLEEFFGGAVSVGAPQWVTVAQDTQSLGTSTDSIPPSDILIILGKNADEKLAL